MSVGQSAKRIVVGLQEEEEGEGARSGKEGGTSMRSPSRHRLAVPAPEGVEVPAYREMEPQPAAMDVPVRTFTPTVERKRRKPPVRKLFSVKIEQQVALMHLALVAAFDIERRDTSVMATGKVGAAWPFPVMFDRNTDYAPDSVVLRPSRPSAADIQFRNDVVDLMVGVAKADVLGAKLMAGRAVRPAKTWEDLALLDPQKRKRWMLDKLRRFALKTAVDLDKRAPRPVLPRALEMVNNILGQNAVARHTRSA